MGDTIKDAAEILELNYECFGSTTWKRKLRLAGIEADNCFYFQNEALIRGRLDIDLNQDPPPDLALEIDIINKSFSRFPIYVHLGVPEIWCYDEGQLKIYQLQNEKYIESEISSIFPTLPIFELPALIEYYHNQGRLALRRAVREWVKEHSRELS